ncbi:MAG: hypothetical protein ABMA15_29640 [Vicinamibacterales bacterium]
MRIRLSMIVTVSAVLAIPTIASAQNVVYACVGNVSKIVRIVGATGKCISSPPLLAETLIRWNIQGPTGTPGTNGTNGTNGKDGAPGINGASGTNGTNGTSVAITGPLPKGDTYCSNGGVSLLDGSTGTTYYLCNGADGAGGQGILESDTTSAEAVGIPNACVDTATLVTPITVTSSAKISATALGIYFKNTSPNTSASFQIQLLDSTNTIVAVSRSEEVYTDPFLGGQFGLGGVLRQGTNPANAAYVAAPGNYTLQLRVNPMGSCTGTDQNLRFPSLTYLVLAN